MINPDAGGILDGDTIVVWNSVDLQVANNDVNGIDDCDTTGADRSIAADGSTGGATNDGLVVSYSEADRKFEFSLKNDVQAGRSCGSQDQSSVCTGAGGINGSGWTTLSSNDWPDWVLLAVTHEIKST